MLTIHISVTRNPERARLWDRARDMACARGETTTKFVLRAIAREIAQREKELAGAPISEQIAAQDRDVIACLGMLTEEERKKYGL